MTSVRAPAKLNLCLHLGERRADGLHELRSLFCPLALSDRIVVSEAERRRGGLPRPSRARTWRRRRSDACERRAGRGRRCGSRSTSGSRWRPGSAAAAPTRRRCCGSPRARSTGLEEIAAGLGADVPSQLRPGFALVGGAGERVEPLPAPAEFGVVLIAAAEGLATADVYAEADRLGLGRIGRGAEPGRGRACATPPRSRGFAGSGRSRAARQRPRAGGALAAAGDRDGARGAATRRAPARCSSPVPARPRPASSRTRSPPTAPAARSGPGTRPRSSPSATPIPSTGS